MKLQRHTTSHGSMCDAAEVADLEAKCAELEAKCAELIAEVEEVITYLPNGIFWCAGLIDTLRRAVIKAKGEHP